VVLDGTGVWRLYHTLKTPVIQGDLGVKPVPVQTNPPWLQWETPPPPAEWAGPDFDDRRWQRGPACIGCYAPYLARLCLRGRFEVTDPAKVQGLSLSAGYHGGVVV
jgi:hypothetical protein